MAYYSVAQISALINQQIQSREALCEYLSKASSLTHIVLSEDFFNYPEKTIHDCLWVLSDLVYRASELNDEALNRLLKIIMPTNDLPI